MYEAEIERLRVLGHKIVKLTYSELTIESKTGQQHNIIFRFLNLDEARYIKIPKLDFNYELRENLWVLLVLYMEGMQPFSYLIPSQVFETPNDIFIDK